MGEVIRKGAAAEDVIADIRETLTKAGAKGGMWKSTAEERLEPLNALAKRIEDRRAAAVGKAKAALAELAVADGASDKLLGRVSDDVWNLLGRPAHDPVFDLIYPGGIESYAGGDVSEQPDRMELLAELLESGIHPRLDLDKAKAFGAEIRESAAVLRTKVEAARPLRAALQLADRMYTAVGRSGQVSLGRLKRLWKAEGHSEAEIHSVIPDRPSKSPVSPAEPPA